MAAYGSDEDFAAWLAEQGYGLPVNAPAPAVLRARGSAYVDGYEALWTGYRTGGALQELAWPRTGARFNCVQAIPGDIIPPSIINAAYRAAWLEAETPGVLVGSSSGLGQRVKRERIEGAVDVEYFDDGKPGSSGTPSFIDSMIDGALRAFVCDDSKGAAFLWTLGS